MEVGWRGRGVDRRSLMAAVRRRSTSQPPVAARVLPNPPRWEPSGRRKKTAQLAGLARITRPGSGPSSASEDRPTRAVPGPAALRRPGSGELAEYQKKRPRLPRKGRNTGECLIARRRRLSSRQRLVSLTTFAPSRREKCSLSDPHSFGPGRTDAGSPSSRWRERERASDCLPGRGRSGFSGLLVLRPPQRSVIGVSDGRNEGYVSGPNEGAERCFPDVVIGVSDGRNEGYVSGPNEGAERSGGVFRMSVAAPRPAGSPGRRFGRNPDLCSGPLRAEGSGRRLSPRSRASREPLPPSGNRGRPIWAVARMQAHATGRENDPHHVRAALLSVPRTLHCRRRSARGPGGSPSRSPTPAPARRWGRSG